MYYELKLDFRHRFYQGGEDPFADWDEIMIQTSCLAPCLNIVLVIVSHLHPHTSWDRSPKRT